MDKNDILNDIFENDPLGLLEVKPKTSYACTPDQRLLDSFQEINAFVSKEGREPASNIANISEYQLHARLTNIRDDNEKVAMLQAYDTHGLLPLTKAEGVAEPNAEYRTQKKEIHSIDDIFDNDSLGIFGDEGDDLFQFKHIPKEGERAESDFVARRKKCKDFEKYASLLKGVQKELADGKRKLIGFKQKNLVEGEFYVHNGVLFYLEKINISHKEHYKKDGTRVREDGRTRCIFENGTESNMLKRSVEKILYANGQVVTRNVAKVNEEFQESLNQISENDKEAGYLYALRSKSENPNVSSIADLYKIGYSKTPAKERIKNAENEPTYLMAPVELVGEWKCYNVNPQKVELLLHNFFGSACLELDVFDKKGKRHTPREWFIAPYSVIQEAIALVISGEIVGRRFVDGEVVAWG